MGVIYKITNPNGRIYVGKTKNLKRRISDYKYKLKQRTSIVINSIKKYGWDNHKIEVIEDNIEECNLDEREIFWIKELKTYHYENSEGMNMTKGGEGQSTTWMHDLERRAKASYYFTHVKNPFKGKKHTEETKKIISEKTSKRNKAKGITIPKWGAEKGRLKCITPVLLYNSNGFFVKEYDSMASVTKELGCSHSSIVESCKQIISGVFGKYVFRYKTSEEIPLKIDIGEITPKCEKRPVLLLNKDLTINKEYPSALEAHQELVIPKGTINRAALREHIRPIRKGYIFLYKDLYERLVINK